MILRILTCVWLLLITCSAEAATWLQLNTANDTAGGYYIVIWRENTNAWKPGSTAYGAYTTTRDDFDIQASQNGTTGHYRVQIPSALPVGFIQWSWFKEDSVGTRNHADDEVANANGQGFWNGYRFTPGPDVHTTISTVTSQTALIFDGSGGIASQQDDSLVNYLIRISSPDDGENGSYASSVRRITAHTYDADNTENEITLDSAPDFTVAAGDSIELYLPYTVSSDILDTINDVTASGPIEHTAVPPSRTFTVKSRGDGTMGVVGRIRIAPGETLWYALDLAGTQLAAGDLVNAVNEPTVSGDEAANLTVPSYGILGTRVKFKCVASGSADEADEINVVVEITPESGETLKVTVPVTVLE